MTDELTSESIFIQIDPTNRLHMKRFFVREGGEPVFLLHGSVENGRIFYPRSGNGLAPFLARAGYDVFAADLRGRGASTPPIGRGSKYGQTEVITEEIPAFVDRITEVCGQPPRHWMAHSWGGVLLLSHLARFPEGRGDVRSLVFFGTKRRIQVLNLKKLFMVNFAWFFLARVLVRARGYLPRDSFGKGMEAETDKSHLQCKLWVKGEPWVDSDDGFDYGAALRDAELPPSLWIAGVDDSYLGHPEDVERFRQEAGATNGMSCLLGRSNGFGRDYGHLDMMTHPQAAGDHFELGRDWLSSRTF